MRKALTFVLACGAMSACGPRPLVSPHAAAPPDAGSLLPGGPTCDGGATGPYVTGALPFAGPPGTTVILAGSGFDAGDVVTFTLDGGSLDVPAVIGPSGLEVVIPSIGPGQASIAVRAGTMPPACSPVSVIVTGGALFHVSPTGDDAAAGTAAAPWQTMTHALTSLTPGDLVEIHDGTYVEPQLELHTSGTAAAPIVITNAPGEAPLLSHPVDASSTLDEDTLRIYGSYVIVNGLRLTNPHHPSTAVWIAGPPWVTENAHDVTISGCEVFGAQGSGITVSGSGNLIYRNDIHDNGVAALPDAPFDHGIYAEGGHNVYRSNRIHGNTAWGIHLFEGSSTVPDTGGDLLERNLVFHNGWPTTQLTQDDAGGVIIAAKHRNETLRNNILCDNARVGIEMGDHEDGALIEGNVTCFNAAAGMFMKYAGAGDRLQSNVSYADQPIALASVYGITSDQDTFYVPGGAPSFSWNGSSTLTTFADFQAASGQEANGRVTDPALTRVPSSGFDSAQILTYDFCTAQIPGLCTPLP